MADEYTGLLGVVDTTTAGLVEGVSVTFGGVLTTVTVTVLVLFSTSVTVLVKSSVLVLTTVTVAVTVLD